MRDLFAPASSALAIALGLLSGSMSASAEVVFDGTSGGPSGVLSGDISITESDGLLTSGNDALLHSFELFNVLAGESVSFTHVTPTINNILLRVTGAQPSLIDGTLASDANLWLLNPNGVLFGEQSALDIAGSFRSNIFNGDGAALVLNDGTLFSVDTNLNTLAVARPADFGFVTDVGQGVVADPSLGTVASASPQGDGQLFSISGGSVAGANLFHSFEQFNVFEGNTAEFTAPTGIAAPIANVISRVTGNSQSFLTGTVRATGAGLEGASFWLINPVGLFVGNGAQLDVGRGLHLGATNLVTGFDSLGQRIPFSSQLSSTQIFDGSPEGIKFFSGSTFGNLTVQDFEFNQQGRLGNSTTDGVTLFGGNVRVLDSRLRLETVSSQPNVLQVVAPLGTVELTNSDVQGVTTAEVNRGRVVLQGGRLVANGTTIEVSTSAMEGDQMNRRVIDSTFTNSVSLADSVFRTSTTATSSSGGVIFETPVFQMSGGLVSSRSTNFGETDNIGVEAVGPGAEITLTDGAQFLLDNREALNNVQGVLESPRQIVLLTNGDVVLAGSEAQPIELTADAGPQAGSNGSILIRGENISADHVRVSANTESNVVPVTMNQADQPDQPDQPDATSPFLRMGDTAVFLSSQGRLDVSNSSVRVTSTGVIDAGTLGLFGEEISIADTMLASSASSDGNAGLIGVGSILSLQSDPADDSRGLFSIIATADLSISDSTINADTAGGGDGAGIALGSAGNIILNEVEIGVSSNAPTNGGAAGQIVLFGFGDLGVTQSEITATTESGVPGAINLLGRNVALTGVEILTDSNSPLSGVPTLPNLSIGSNEGLTLFDSTLSASVSGEGGASGILLDGRDVLLVDSSVSASATGSGNAGGIEIFAFNFTIGDLATGRRTEVRTNSDRSQGGDIVLQSEGFAQLINADLVASAGTDGSGGNVQVDVNGGGLILGRSTLLAQAQNGAGGEIDINPTLGAQIFIDGESVLNADSAAGTSGSVIVDSPDTGIVSALSQQEAALAPEAQLEQDACSAATQSASASSLYVREASTTDPFAGGYLGATGTSQSAQGDCL